jgi:serine/threonine-protein kinase RsbW
MAEIPGVTEAFHVFAVQLELTPELDNAFQVAAEELLSNVILYGCPDGRRHTIKVKLEAKADAVSLLLQDDGTPFHILEQPAPAMPSSLEEAAISGLGIHLVRESMDEITYRHADGWNILLLKKLIDSPGDLGLE